MNSEAIILELQEIHSNLQGSAAVDAVAMEALKAIIFSVNDPVTVQEVLKHPSMAELATDFSARWSQYLGGLELAFSTSILKGDFACSSLLALENYSNDFQEIASLPASCLSGQFIMAGCGAYPETLIKLQRVAHSFSKIIALDSNSQALEVASEVMRKIVGTNKCPTFLNENATTYSYISANILLVANGLKHKEATIRQAVATMPPASITLVRVPILLGKLIYEDVSAYLEHSGLTIVDCIQPSSHSKTYIIRH